jgi:hypothetical protein
MAPMKRSRQRIVSVSMSQLRKWMTVPTLLGAAANTVLKSTELKTRNTPVMPRTKPKSPTRLTRKALMAAALADGRSYQWPMSR